MRITVIAFTGLALALAACGSAASDAPKDIVGFCKDTKCPPDNNPCTADCDEAKDKCVYTELADGTPCEDGSKCTTGDLCGAAGCKGIDVVCDDKNPCTTDTCDPKVGCAHMPATAPCDADGSVCTDGDACKDGKCTAGKDKDCDDGKPCTEDKACDTVKGCLNKPMDGACEDGDKCTLGDACKAGKCDPGAPDKCDDKKPCTDDSCNPKAGCDHVNNTIGCNDDDACTETDKCKDGECKPGSTKDCKDDGSPCTLETCDKVKGCTTNNAPAGTKCDDNDKCTEGDGCAAGACEPGSKKNCPDDGDVCTAEFCDPKIDCTWKPAPDGKICSDGTLCTDGDACKGGTCIAGAKLDCDDKKPCTDNSCDAKIGCKYAQNTEPCEDGNKCTVGDLCKLGACAAGATKVCDDGNPCSVDSCDPITGSCGSVPGKDSTPCDDGSVCTTDDACKAGKCGGTAMVCKDDGNPCTSEACDSLKGCNHAPTTAPCNDSDACTEGDACKDGKCAAGATVKCDDGVPCTVDTCDKLDGCKHSADNAKCDDADVCTVDACDATQGCSNKKKNCDDGNTCTQDTCDKLKGCQAINSPGPCLSGTCHADDACLSGKCVAGKTAYFSQSPVDGVSFSGITAANDGGVLLTGYVGTAAWVQRLKPDGTVKWTSSAFMPGGNTRANGAVQLGSGFWLVTGSGKHPNWGAALVVLSDVDGAVSMATWLDQAEAGMKSITAQGRKVMLITSGGTKVYVLAQDTTQDFNGDEATTAPGLDVAIYELPMLNLAKVSKFSSFAGNDLDAPRAMVEVPTGGFYVAGYTRSSDCSITAGTKNNMTNDYDGLVVRFTGSNTVAWSARVGDFGVQKLFGVALTPDGGCVAAGTNAGDGWLVRLGPDGTLKANLKLSSYAAAFEDLVANGDGTLTAVGGNLAVTKIGLDANGIVPLGYYPYFGGWTALGVATLAGGAVAIGGGNGAVAVLDVVGNSTCPSGICKVSTVDGCSDGNACTVDFCSPAGCQHQPMVDGMPCSSTQTCTGGKCGL